MNMQENKTLGKGRKILLGLALIFILPFTVAATLHLLNLKPASRSYGDLITPPKALKLSAMVDMQNKEFTAQHWLKIWSIVTLDATGCEAQCLAQLNLLKQMHISLGKEYKRVQRILLVTDHHKADAYKALQAQYPDLIILASADTEAANLVGQFSVKEQKNGNVYLVDPLGNLMMSYSKNQNPKGIQTDMKRLLKNSWAG